MFLSWSGDYSRDVAGAFGEFLRFLIDEVDPFVSTNMDPGTRWLDKLSTELELTNFGIVFVTRENQQKPWLNFEAGALAKSVEHGRVIPIAIDLKTTDIDPPLGQFQVQALDEESVRRVVEQLNSAADRPLKSDILNAKFDKWWPDFNSRLDAIGANIGKSTVSAPVRDDRDILEEVLATVREIARSTRSKESDLVWGDLASRPSFEDFLRARRSPSSSKLSPNALETILRLDATSRPLSSDMVSHLVGAFKIKEHGDGALTLYYKDSPHAKERELIDIISKAMKVRINVVVGEGGDD
ncbi:TIR domain-containing protein [Amycolatopsis thermophila]|uniref:TIR domain-containing protein n=1 Tax=Amycolatopsis thermophila TaxID=206084 RepID=UPI0027D90193|nr:TIR domain-containing protein [Amycolatopsis thermophila]